MVSPGYLQLLLLALLAVVVSSFSLGDIEKELSAVNTLPSSAFKQSFQQPRQAPIQPQFMPVQQAPMMPSYQPYPQPSFQPVVVPFQQPQAPTLVQLGSNKNHRHHRHYHHRRRHHRSQQQQQQPQMQQPQSTQMTQFQLQQQLSLLQTAAAIRNQGTVCQRRALADRAKCGAKVTCLLTVCQLDGSFAARQCDPTTGHCWCVDNLGQEMDRTRTFIQGSANSLSANSLLEVQCAQLRQIRLNQPALIQNQQNKIQSLLQNPLSSALSAIQMQQAIQKQQAFQTQQAVQKQQVAKPAKPEIQKPQDDDTPRTLSLEEIQAIITKTAQQMVAQQMKTEKIPVLTDKPAPKPQVAVHSCAEFCRSHCSTQMDILGCLGQCDTKCGGAQK